MKVAFNSCQLVMNHRLEKNAGLQFVLLNFTDMDAFAPIPPDWTQSAVHAQGFCCPTCRSDSLVAENVWINRRSPVFTEDHRRKWQEFYYCSCRTVWWAWSSDRPPTDLKSSGTSEAS